MRLVKFLIPLLIFGAIAVFLFKGLSRDPSIVPSPLVDKPLPAFSLPRLDNQQAWSTSQYKGQVWLLNYWGSWCAACVVEHPLLNQLAKDKVLPIVGVAWKDKPENSIAWLNRYGDPFAVTVSDLTSTAAIDLGVYGAPESFLIDKNGIIRYKQIGPFNEQTVQQTLIPLVRQLQAE